MNASAVLDLIGVNARALMSAYDGPDYGDSTEISN
jgi:hypothetical protein